MASPVPETLASTQPAATPSELTTSTATDTLGTPSVPLSSSHDRLNGSSYWTDPETGIVWAKVGNAEELPTNGGREELPGDVN